MQRNSGWELTEIRYGPMIERLLPKRRKLNIYVVPSGGMHGYTLILTILSDIDGWVSVFVLDDHKKVL